jgi:hypothetical protein
MENKNQPAYPVSEEATDRIENGITIFSGLTKREYFAAMAMQGILAKCYTEGGFIKSEIEDIVHDSCAFADLLLAELEK